MSEMSLQLIVKCVIMTEIELTCNKEDRSAVLWKVSERNVLTWSVACSFYRTVHNR